MKCSINVIYLCGKLILLEVVELEDTFAFVMEKIQMLFGIEYNTHKILREKNGPKIYCMFFFFFIYCMFFEVASTATSRVLCKYLLFSAIKGTLLGWFTLYLYSGKTVNFRVR